MAVTTWEEALEGLTPQEVWALRKIRVYLRGLLFCDGVEYSTKKARMPEGYGGLERIEIKIGDTVYVMRGDYSDSTNRAMGQLFLALDETIYSFGNEMLKESDPT